MIKNFSLYSDINSKLKKDKFNLKDENCFYSKILISNRPLISIIVVDKKYKISDIKAYGVISYMINNMPKITTQISIIEKQQKQSIRNMHRVTVKMLSYTKNLIFLNNMILTIKNINLFIKGTAVNFCMYLVCCTARPTFYYILINLFMKTLILSLIIYFIIFISLIKKSIISILKIIIANLCTIKNHRYFINNCNHLGIIPIIIKELSKLIKISNKLISLC